MKTVILKTAFAFRPVILLPRRGAICISHQIIPRLFSASLWERRDTLWQDAAEATPLEPKAAYCTCVTCWARGRNRSQMPSAALAANIATGPRWSRLFGGPVQMHCPTHVKNDGNVRGTRITNTGLHDMGGKSLNKRRPAAVPGSPDHNREPPVTVVVLKQVGIIIAPRATRGKTSQIMRISSQKALVTQQGAAHRARKQTGAASVSAEGKDHVLWQDPATTEASGGFRSVIQDLCLARPHPGS